MSLPHNKYKRGSFEAAGIRLLEHLIIVTAAAAQHELIKVKSVDFLARTSKKFGRVFPSLRNVPYSRLYEPIRALLSLV